jgi:hypothetical protein
MEENNIKKDKFIEDILKKGGVEKPSTNFTRNVMEQVNPSTDTADDRLLGPWQWMLIGFSVVAAIVTLIVLDVSFLDPIFSFSLNDLNLGLQGGNVVSYFNSIFENFQLSTITIMAVSAVLILLGIERLFRHGFTRTNLNLL